MDTPSGEATLPGVLTHKRIYLLLLEEILGENSFYWDLTLLHSERPKLYAILVFLSAIGLTPFVRVTSPGKQIWK